VPVNRGGALFGSAARDLGNCAQRRSGHSNLAVGPVQRIVGYQCGSWSSGDVTLDDRQPNQIAVRFFGHQNSRRIDQQVETETL
jgi:hypothetical protein